MHMPGRDGKGKFTTPSQSSLNLIGISHKEVEAENILRKNVPCDILSLHFLMGDPIRKWRLRIFLGKMCLVISMAKCFYHQQVHSCNEGRLSVGILAQVRLRGTGLNTALL